MRLRTMQKQIASFIQLEYAKQALQAAESSGLKVYELDDGVCTLRGSLPSRPDYLRRENANCGRCKAYSALPRFGGESAYIAQSCTND